MSEALRPRPPVNGDNRFFFDALEDGRIAVQGCDSCGELRHPPVAMCPRCHSLEWSPREVSGEGELTHYVVMHHPVLPPFEPGHLIGVVELSEGPRLVTNLEGVDREDVVIGMHMKVHPRRVDDELVLTVAHPM